MKKNINWKSNISILNLRKRSLLINKIRNFFISRGIYEIETPYFSKYKTPENNIKSFKTKYKKDTLYLATSPEFYMKRLIALGSGAIFQICRVFRNEEYDKYHNPEFTILEWYQPEYTMQDLIVEVYDFLKEILYCKRYKIYSYKYLFQKYLNFDPFNINRKILSKKIKKIKLKINNLNLQDKDTLLQILFTFKIVPKFSIKNCPYFIYHFPISQSIFSESNISNKKIAERFEVFYNKLELANGCRELTNFEEQKKRINQVINKKKFFKFFDIKFLESLKKNQQKYSGVAVGIDRLIMFALKEKSIKKAMSFDLESY